MNRRKIAWCVCFGFQVCAVLWIGVLSGGDRVNAAETPGTVTGSYVAYRFEPAEGWHLRTAGDAGATGRQGKTWSLDFSAARRGLA